jgi:phage terminase large subunit-like protein
MRRRLEWQQAVYAEMANAEPPPPELTDSFGLHWSKEDVQLAVYGVEEWHVLPFAGGLFDQPESLLFDMIRYRNKRREVLDDGTIHAPPNAYEDQPLAEQVKRTQL